MSHQVSSIFQVFINPMLKPKIKWEISYHLMIKFHKVSLFFVYDNLVGGLEHYFFHSVGNVIIPTDEIIFFRGVETTKQIL